MSFLETVERARAFLERNRRVSLRALRLEFEVGDDRLEALVDELVDVQRVAVREGGTLAWSDDTPAKVGSPAGDPRAEIPPHLADKIREARPNLEGERKQVTVLFVDVKGSTALTEQAGAERWADVLEGYLKLLAEGVHRFEGTVSQYTGDGIMALFGAPIAHEDHAARACLSALWLRDALAEYAEQVKREHGLALETRIGLNSGEVVVGKIGEDLGMDFTAQGQTVHLAQRMEQLGEAGRPCLAPATAALVEGLFALEDRGEFEVKGISKPLRVHALLGTGEAPTRLAAARSRGLSPFVGRVHELASLDAALAQSRDGRGQIAGVVGEAGVGKSRLCAQFLERVRAEGTSVYAAHCLSHGRTLSFLPMRELLRALLGISEGDPEDEQRAKVAEALGRLDASLAELLPLLLDFLAIPDLERAAPPLSPEARQRRLLDLVRRLVRARSVDSPAVLFLDDAHWIDAGSDAFLAQLAEAVADTQALLLVNFRPEYRADWMEGSGYQQLALRPLATGDVEALLDELVGAETSTRLRDRIVERTGGNPFFVEEVVRSLAESGALEGERGAYRLARPIESLEVPATVQPVLAGRIDRLAEREKQALQAAAVIGREFPEPILSAVLDWPERDVSDALRALKDGEFLLQQSLHPVPEYAFRHPLTQEVALGSQLRERRARTHAAVAQALEAAHADHLDEQAALIAHHCEEAGEALRAARWHTRAAEWLFKSDLPQALVHWRRVYELAKAESPTTESVELLFGACVRLVMNSYATSFPDEERDRFAAEARAIAQRTGNQAGLYLVELGLGVSRSLAGGSRESPLVPTRRALELAEKLDDPTARFLSHFQLGNVLWVLGSLTEALRETEKCLELANPVDPEFGMALAGFSLKNFARFQRASILMWSGRPREAKVDFDRSLEVSLPRKEGAAVCQMYIWSGPWLEELTGTPQQALFRAAEAVEWAERAGDDFNRTATAQMRGMAELRAGHIAEALQWLRYTDHMQRELGVTAQSLNLGQGLLAEAHLAAGDSESARTVAARCAIEQGRPVFDLYGHLSRARVLRALDGAAARSQIEASLERVQQLLEMSEAWAFGPLLLEERARLLETLGEPEGATRALREAERAFAAVGATGHVERLTQELGA